MITRFLRHFWLFAGVLPFQAFSQWTSLSGVVNQYYAVTAVNPATGTLTLGNTTGLSAGDRVVVMVMKGATFSTANTSSYGTVSSLNNVGSFEFATICEVNSPVITLQYLPLTTYSVASGQVMQVIKVPQVVKGEITSTVQPQAWNGTTGGVVVIEATDTLRLLAGINASGLGFRGGANNSNVYNCNANIVGSPAYFYPQADGRGGFKGEGIGLAVASQETGKGPLISGGGGGNDHNTGGAGGGNYGAGGLGGTRINSVINCLGNDPGLGGKSLLSNGYSSLNTRVFMGGGGGGAHQNNGQSFPGGNGGGMVIIRCLHLEGGSNSIIADGISAPNSRSDGASGGGAGGSIIIEANTASAAALVLSAKGGNGGGSNYINVANCLGPGGGGGGGAVWTSFTPGTGITVTVNGGAKGTSSSVNTNTCQGADRGATAGANGSALTGLILPEANTTPSNCVLPLLPEAWLSASRSQGGVSWAVTDLEMPVKATLIRENSQAKELMDTLLYAGNHEGLVFDHSRPEGRSRYLLTLTDLDGRQLAMAATEAWFTAINEPPVYLFFQGNESHLIWRGDAPENLQLKIYALDGRLVGQAEWRAGESGDVFRLEELSGSGMYVAVVYARTGSKRFTFLNP